MKSIAGSGAKSEKSWPIEGMCLRMSFNAIFHLISALLSTEIYFLEELGDL